LPENLVVGLGFRIQLQGGNQRGGTQQNSLLERGRGDGSARKIKNKGGEKEEKKTISSTAGLY